MMGQTHHFHNYRQNPLDIKSLDEFDVAISRYTQSEQRRRRLSYLREAAQQMKPGKSLLRGFGWFMIPLAIIPILWPFFIFAWFMCRKAASMMESELESALDYWGIHEVEIDTYVSDNDMMD
jgi:hypothetical protein